MTQLTNKYFQNVRGVVIAHMNVRSLPSNKINFKKEFDDCDIDCLSISETWLHDMMPDSQVILDGFNLIRHDRQTLNDRGETQTGGGLCVYLKQEYTFSVSELEQFNRSETDMEIQCLTFSKKFFKKCILINIYRPPHGNVYTFCDELLAMANQLGDYLDHEIFYVCDFNVDLKSVTKRNEARYLKDTILMLGCKQYIKEFTHFDTNGNTSMIDLACTNSDNIIASGTLDVHIADHLCIYVVRAARVEENTPVHFKGRSYRNYIAENFKLGLWNSDWGSFWDADDAEEAWQIIIIGSN